MCGSKIHLRVMRLLLLILVIVIFPVLTGCSTSDSGSPLANEVIKIQTEGSATLKLSLTDAPNDELSSVVVNVSHMEVLLEGMGKKGRLIVAENLGPVDLLTLQNGVTLPLSQASIPAGVRATQVRLVLNGEGNFSVKNSSEMCPMATPSAQKSGVKIVFGQPIEFVGGLTYSLLIDFDALKSVVVQGNGGCLLKPVLKLKEAKVIDPGENEDSDDDDLVIKLPNEGEENDTVNEGWEPVESGEPTDPSLYDWELENFF